MLGALVGAFFPRSDFPRSDTALYARRVSESGVRAFVEAATGGRIERFERTATGASRATWLVDVEGPGGTARLVARRDTGDGPLSGTELSLAREAAVYRALAPTPVRIPRLLAASDDGFHPPGDPDPAWSETSWFSFSAPERRLAGTVYPLFRPNLGTCSVAVYVWDDAEHAPWRVRYGRCLWHLPMPDGDLTDCRVGGLHIACVEPLSRYRVEYEDEGRISLSLDVAGIVPPVPIGVGGGRGHVDQPCRVRGSLRLAGEEIPIDGFDMRDRSWHVRDDTRSTQASYSYAIAGEDDAFLAAGFHDGAALRIIAGFLLRDGEIARVVSGERRVLERHAEHGYPLRVLLAAQDEHGRRIEAEGRCLSRLANQATPGMFAWMSLTEWQLPAGPAFGQDQDIGSPGQIPGMASPATGA